MTQLTQVWVKDWVPTRFVWNRKPIGIQRVLDYWREVGEWWHDEPELWIWRVQGWNQGVYELAWDTGRRQWWMYHIYD